MTTVQKRNYAWYDRLRKPTFAPPKWLFGPVWSVLYILIAISFGATLYQIIKGAVPVFIALPLFLNLIANAIFTPLQFRLRSNILAAIDIVVVLGTLVWFVIVVYRYMPWVTYINIPYLLWVSFATVVQLCVTWLNRNKNFSHAS